MRSKATLTFLVFLHSLCFARPVCNEQTKLYVTCKVWGFLKYYHPVVASGKLNWDMAMINFIKNTEDVKDWETMNKKGVVSILSLGYVPTCSNCESKNDQWADLNFNLNWINDSNYFDSKISFLLSHIELNRHQGSMFYALPSEVGHYNGVNEAVYSKEKFLNVHFRRLQLCRYWNTIEYFFPYKYQMDIPWDSTLMEYCSSVNDSMNLQEYHLWIARLSERLNDTHAWYSTPETQRFWGSYWIPYTTILVGDSLVVYQPWSETLAKKSQLKPGDIILTSDGRNWKERFDSLSNYISGSNLSQKKYQAGYNFLRSDTNYLDLTISRNNKTFQLKETAYKFSEFKRDSLKETLSVVEYNQDIAYINLGTLHKKEASEIFSNNVKKKVIILDIRNYPDGVMFNITPFLYQKSKNFVCYLMPDFSYPGKFLWDGYGMTNLPTKKKVAEHFKGELILLVDEQTQSHAEYTAMSFQCYEKCFTIGRQTSGADGNVAKNILLDGWSVHFSGIGIFYTDHTETQRKDIKLDSICPVSYQDIINGNDGILAMALAYANQKIAE